MEKNSEPLTKELRLFFAIVALTGFAMGMTDSVISNFFKDAYDVSAVQRGFLEFPRELPGVLCFLIIAMTSALGDVRLAIISQALCAAGALALGFFTPTFAVMCIFVFVNSLGMHVFFPLQDSIGMSIIGKKDLGKRMGQYSSVRTAFLMLSGMIVFAGFGSGIFSFKTQVKFPFIIGAAGFMGVFILLILLYTKCNFQGEKRKKEFKVIIKKKYAFYYILAVLVGVRRQIMFVFGPWVLIDILNQQADTLALLGVISSLIGVVLLPIVGRCIDRFGVKIVLLSEGWIYILVYVVYGLMSRGFAGGSLAVVGLPVFIVSSLFILDRLAANFGMVRFVYLKSIAADPADITPTISTGISMDHVMSIACAYLGGIAWQHLGPEYIFYTAAALSIINVVVALMIKPEKPTLSGQA